MKAQDLRIGDWYKADLEIKGSIEAKLGFENDREFIMTKNHLKIILQFDLEFAIKPIPLSEKWLIDFGFIKNGRFYRIGMVKLTNRGGWRYEYGGTIVELKHVHQLQDLYHALTSEGLTIKQD